MILFLYVFLFIEVACGFNFIPWYHRIVHYIINGEPVKEGEYPFVVSLQLDNVHFCGGSIIGESIVLTAAHCLQVDNLEQVKVVAGATQLDTFSPTRQERTVKEVVFHPEFNIHSFSYDIAVIKLSSPFTFNTFVSPIDLPTHTITATSGTVTGWGSTVHEGPISNKLLKAPLALVDYEKCQEVFGDDAEKGVFCAVSFLKNEDACGGDSGGPFLCETELCGIISAGLSCGTAEPSLYSDVFYFHQWIQDNHLNI